jgi:hypothetical protein
MAQEEHILIKNQLVALEKKKEFIKEIESYHLGYLLSQDT